MASEPNKDQQVGVCPKPGLTTTQVISIISGVILTVVGSISGIEIKQASKFESTQQAVDQLKYENSMLLLKIEHLLQQHEKMLQAHPSKKNDEP